MHKVLGPPSQVHVHNKLTVESVQWTSTLNHLEKSLWSYTSSLNLSVHPMDWSNLTKSVTLFALHDLVVPHMFSSPSLFGLCPRSTGCSNTHCWNCTTPHPLPPPQEPIPQSPLQLLRHLNESEWNEIQIWMTISGFLAWNCPMNISTQQWRMLLKSIVVPMIPCLCYR